MRTPTLQYLYLQKPVTMILFICIISVLPWLGLSELNAPATSPDAAVADTMLKTGEWVLPVMPSGSVNYDHPMLHGLIVLFSYAQGYVSKFTLQLPGALAFIVMIVTSLIFFGRRVQFQEAFISTLFLITSFGMQNLSAASSGDLLFATFIFVAMTQLYRWEEEWELKGIPVDIALLLSCAILTKGLMGMILPIATFTIYLLYTHKHSYLTIAKSMFYMAVSSLFLPVLWYVAIWKEGGMGLLQDVLAIEFSNFWGLEGDEHNFFYIIPLLAIGFMPWIFFFFFSLFGVKKESVAFKGCSGVKLFSLVSLVVMLLAYAIMPVKRASYLLPVYPFITIFLARYALYITEYRTLCTRLFAAVYSLLVLVGLMLWMFPVDWGFLPVMEFSMRTSILLVLTWLMLFAVIYQMSRKINIKILYATIALTFAVNMIVNASGLVG